MQWSGQPDSLDGATPISGDEEMDRLNSELSVSPSTSAPGGPAAATGTPRDSRGRKIVREVSLALAIYGMIGWIYVAISALIVPYTLALPLTHLFPHLREDTSGVLSFIISFLAFITYRMTKPEKS